MATKCTMADKSTKTDDAFLNGDIETSCPTTTNAATMTTVVSTEASPRPALVAASTNTRQLPPVTTHSQKEDVRTEPPLKHQQPASPPPVRFIRIRLNVFYCYICLQETSGNPPRMSYAQVAQHHKDGVQKEKVKDKLSEVSSNGKSHSSSVSGSNTSVTKAQPERDSKGM